jgi:hypothetical protein
MCSNKQSTLYNKKNKDKVDSIKQKYVDNNKEKVVQSKKEWFDKNPEYKKKYYNKNIQNILEKRKKNYRDNTEKKIEYSKAYAKTYKDIINKKNKIRYDTDVLYKLKSSMRSRLRSFLKTKQVKKQNGTFQIIGCTPEYLKEYIEKQFFSTMSWDNYGLYGWHIDHIIPLSSALKLPKDGRQSELERLDHYSNIQLLTTADNLAKRDRLDWTIAESVDQEFPPK